jgi:integrase
MRKEQVDPEGGALRPREGTGPSSVGAGQPGVTGPVLMHLCPGQAHALLPRIDPGRLRFGLAVGLRDGAILALVAAGLSAVEIAALKASEVTMQEGRVVVYVNRQGGTWSAVLATDLGARLLAWITECRLCSEPEPVFRGVCGPLAHDGIRKVLDRYRRGAQKC